MEKAPGFFAVTDFLEQKWPSQTEIDGEWVPARPLGYFSLKHRLVCAWMVFTGRADVLIWPKGQ